MNATMVRSAFLSPDGQYRYTLARDWAPEAGRVCWVMLNPSTADAEQDDPTIRRCMGFSRSWGYGGIVVVNLFAYRATQPASLRGPADPVGPLNDQYIEREAFDSRLVVAAWGQDNAIRHRDKHVRRLISGLGKAVHTLGLTKAGHPRHPLYVSGSTEPVVWAQ